MFFSGNSKAKSDTPGIVVKNFSLCYCIYMGIVLFYFQKVGQDGHSIPPYKRFILPCGFIPCQGDFFMSAAFLQKNRMIRQMVFIKQTTGAAIHIAAPVFFAEFTVPSVSGDAPHGDGDAPGDLYALSSNIWRHSIHLPAPVPTSHG